MDFNISKEQMELRDEIITFAKENLNDEDKMQEFSYEMWEKTAEFGLFGLNVGEEYGGLNESFLTSAIAIEALGYACVNNGFVFAVNNHIWVGLNLIALYGSDYLKEKYLRTMVAGKKIGAIAITEPDSGSDAYSMCSTATEEDDCYVLNGNKMFISNGTIADVFIVFCNLTVNGKNKILGLVVEKSMDGVTIGKDIKKMGLDSCPMAEVVFEQVKIPKKNVLGNLNNGKNILMSALEWERCYEFACHVGAMQRVMERCITYANERKQFGKSIAEFQAISHKIADMKISIEMSRLMLYKIACLKDNGKSAFVETSIFKVYVSESYIKTCKDAMQIFGAYGYTSEYGLEQEMRDALACSVYSGTNEMQRNAIFSMANLDL